MLILYAMPQATERKWSSFPPLDGSDWLKTKELRVFVLSNTVKKALLLSMGKKL
jgi:hypothetical protein